MAGIALLATIVALGPALEAGAAGLLDALGGTAVEAGTDVLAAASPLAGGAYARIAATSVAAGVAFVRRALAFAAPLLGGSPFDRRP
jgi:urease accessory protein